MKIQRSMWEEGSDVLVMSAFVHDDKIHSLQYRIPRVEYVVYGTEDYYKFLEEKLAIVWKQIIAKLN
jgi:hypothetical protein